MQMNLQGQTVAVFGAARGIGRAIADIFHEEQCCVLGFDLTPPDSTSSPMDYAFFAGDVTSSSDLKAFADKAVAVDHVVFCVGIGSGSFGFPFWNVSPDAWARVLNVNLIGAAQVAHALAPHMAKRGSGSFLFFTSVAGQIGSQTDPPYSASKAGLINFMQCVAKDLAPHGVRANAIAPGMVKTDLNRSVWQWGQQRLPEPQRVDYETWAAEKIKKVSPLGQWQDPAEFASMAIYLASHHARNITGQTINIDGGWVMHS
ncbi:MAG TPA: oxidoreductase [Planctomycetaceae bacterium]|nr:oxidoreductase [Planctomycetaceae bacterium]